MNYIYSDNQSVLPSELTIYCDEAWRWPLAGPVWVWVMISHGRVDTSSFQDSKKLTSNQRVSAYQKILEYTQQWLITHAWWSATAYEIDRYGIIQAIQLATLRALAQAFKVYFLTHMRDKLLQSVWWSDHIFATLIDNLITWRNDQDVDRVRWFVATFIQEPQTLMKLNQLIRDGNHTFGLDILLWCHVKTIIQGDAKVPLIWAASIVAKVQRDAYMTAISKKYPKRWFETHKWYGTLNHRNLIHRSKRLTPEHRKSFCTNYMTTSKKVISNNMVMYKRSDYLPIQQHREYVVDKPKLLLHICCAPDLSWPLRRLKHYFKLYLFRYNPNIHPKPEHDKRYAEFVKLFDLEWGDYEIIEDRYEPKEFFDAFVKHKTLVDTTLEQADRNTVLKRAGEMLERSDRCNPCYLMRLEQAALQAQKHGITYFTSTLLISPKKLADKLFRFGLESQERVTWTKFLWFDFAKKGGYEKANKITKEYNLYRQNYCGCGRTIPKKGQVVTGYKGG